MVDSTRGMLLVDIKRTPVLHSGEQIKLKKNVKKRREAPDGHVSGTAGQPLLAAPVAEIARAHVCVCRCSGRKYPNRIVRLFFVHEFCVRLSARCLL